MTAPSDFPRTEIHTMKLIGILRSALRPPHRRFSPCHEHALRARSGAVSTSRTRDQVQSLTRVPALVLDDGEALIDSSVILRALRGCRPAKR